MVRLRRRCQKAAVTVQDVHQVVPPGRNVQVHQVDVPHLIRMIGFARPLQRRRWRNPAATQQIVLLQDAIDLVRPQIDHILIYHLPGEPLISHLRVRPCEFAHRCHLFRGGKQRLAPRHHRPVG